MALPVYFKHFDPLTGKLPDRFDWMFAEIAFRARRMLSSRSTEEIMAAASILTQIHRAPGYKDPLWEELEQGPIPTMMYGEEVQLIASSNEVEALYKNICNVSLSNYSSLREWQWHEMFAVLALSYMDQICALVDAQENWVPDIESKWLPGKVQPNPFPKLTDSFIENKVSDWLILSQQAISFADALQNQEEIVRNLRSAESRQAARIRHEGGSGSLKEAVIGIYQEKYQTRSNRDAARRIFDDLRMQQRLIYDETGKVIFEGHKSLQTDDPEKRFEIWIGQFKRKK